MQRGAVWISGRRQCNTRRLDVYIAIDIPCRFSFFCTITGSLVIPSITMSAQNANSIPWNPDSKSFPTRKELPKIDNAPEDAAWVWGKEDNVRRDQIGAGQV